MQNNYPKYYSNTDCTHVVILIDEHELRMIKIVKNDITGKQELKVKKDKYTPEDIRFIHLNLLLVTSKLAYLKCLKSAFEILSEENLFINRIL